MTVTIWSIFLSNVFHFLQQNKSFRLHSIYPPYVHYWMLCICFLCGLAFWRISCSFFLLELFEWLDYIKSIVFNYMVKCLGSFLGWAQNLHQHKYNNILPHTSHAPYYLLYLSSRSLSICILYIVRNKMLHSRIWLNLYMCVFCIDCICAAICNCVKQHEGIILTTMCAIW